MKFPLPQKKPISAAAFTEARKKLDEKLFKELNSRIVATCQTENSVDDQWFNHRLFAVDGSKLNLPRPLTQQGYKTPSDQSHYPQGLLSCLYQLKSKIPYDFDLVNHGNERQCALAHLKTLIENDVVVYDRGYYGYAVLYYHIQAGVHPIFRLQKKLNHVIDEFRNSDTNDKVVQILPSKPAQCDIRKKYPDIVFTPLNIRLIKYQVNGEVYCLGTTLMDSKYTAEDFKNVYHARWGIEELYKVSKDLIDVTDFHGRTERTVKQELFAYFVLITMSRLCANESEDLLAKLFSPMDKEKISPQKRQVNFKNTLASISRYLESFMFVPARYIQSTIDEIISSIVRHHQKIRPGRSYDRKSMKPGNKWRSSNA